jgi:lipopolysaccharide export system permease protein
MTIDRYLLRQTLMPLIAVTVILSSLFVTFTMARLLTDAASGLLQLSEVFRVAWFRWLIAQDVLIPISFYLSIILVWGRLYQDLEMDALAAGGIGTLRLMRPMITLALLLSLVVAIFSLGIRPWAWYQVYDIKIKAEASAEIERIRSARFNLYAGDYTVFIERIEPGGELEGVFVRKRENGELEMLSSSTGHFTAYVTSDAHQLTLYDAISYHNFNDGPDLYGRFGTLTLNLDATTPGLMEDKAKLKSSRDLLDSPLGDDSSELQWRLSAPITTLLLCLAGLPLARSGPRQSRYSGLILAMAVYAIYFNLMGVARTWVEQGQLQSIIWVHGLLLACASIFWWRSSLRR